MKTVLFLLICLLLPLQIQGQQKTGTFSNMEVNHIRVATPRLFDKSKTILLHLDSLGQKDYCFPLPGGKVISPYGRGGGRHTGIDIKTRANDTIRSAFAGVVRMSKPYSPSDNVIVARLPPGRGTVYTPNPKTRVQRGDRVRAGQATAQTGRTGRATTEHLHFETRINGQHFNPNILFNMKEESLRHECIRCTKNANGIVVKPVLKNNGTK